MSEKRKCNEIFINNLKYLMEYCNEKSDDLSTDLDLDTSTVNKYLSGRRTNIDDEYLTKIAIHYRCPKTVLLYGDVKKIYSQKREFEFEDLISIIRTPENIDAKSIDSKLVSDNEIIINKLKGPIFSNSVSASAFVDFIVDCKNTHKMLKVSYNKNKKLDVLIWVVWYELLISILSSFGFEKNDSEEEIEQKIKIQNVLDGIWSDFYDESHDDFFKNCQLLKNSKWGDLVYYYIALRFIFGFGDTVYNIDENKMIGAVFMKCLKKIGNEYAANFFAFGDKYLDA